MAVAIERAIIFQEARDAIERHGTHEELNIGDLLSGEEAKWINDRRAMGRGEVKPLRSLPKGSVLIPGFSEYMLAQQRLRLCSLSESTTIPTLKTIQEAA